MGGLASFAPLLAAVALIWKVVDFAKLVRVKDLNAVVTQLLVWGVGVAVTFLLAASDFASGVPVGAKATLATVNAASLLLIGLSLGASGSVGYDLIRGIDNSNSAAMPSLVTGELPPTAEPATPPTRRRKTVA
jgi:hypothetical protein